MNILKEFTQRFKTVEEQPKDNSLLLIPCVNCEEYVKSNKINHHARICTSISQNMECITVFEENNFKLKHIRLSLMDKKNNSYALRLGRIIELVSQISTIGNVEISCCQAYLDELNQLQTLPCSSLNLSLYIERIRTLIQQKIEIMQKELNQKQYSIKLYQEQCASQIIDKKHKQIKSEILTNMSSCDLGVHQELECQPSYDQRIFNSKVLKWKLNSKVKHISASNLWQRVQELKLKSDQWDDFLKTTFSKY